MQRKPSPILLIAVLTLGILALGGAALLMMKPGATTQAVAAVPTPTPQPFERFVAVRDIPPRTVVTRAMLRSVSQTEELPPNAAKNMDDLSGQITSQSIARGETVVLSSFTPRVQRVIPASIEIPSGFRAVAIYVDGDQTAAGLVDVDDRVDVIATHRLTLEKGKEQRIEGAINFTAGRTIATNLRVLAVDKSLNAPKPTPTPIPGAPIDPAAGPAAPPPPPPAPAAPTPKIRILLAADPASATRLVAAGDQGILHVTIRNPIDGDNTVPPEMREHPVRLVNVPKEASPLAPLNDLMKGMGDMMKGPPPTMPTQRVPELETIPKPVLVQIPNENVAPSEPQPREITVIRGTEKTRVLVPQR